MQLKELFEIQAGLDIHILKNHPVLESEEEYSRLKKKHVALLVELGEMMNEWRKFKFWSDDQEPRTKNMCKTCEGEGVVSFYEHDKYLEKKCDDCEGTGERNYLLEELVDCLHFVLSIGLEHEFHKDVELLEIEPITSHKAGKGYDINTQYIQLSQTDWDVYETGHGGYYLEGLELFLGMCEMLGFNWDEVEQAYMIKNKINHQRQLNGY